MSAKREQTHFDDEIYLYPNGTYYYRGFPKGAKTRKEISLKIKKGATQKEVVSRKEAVLEKYNKVRASDVRGTFLNLAPLYVKDRQEEAENPEHLSAGSLYECKLIIEKHLIPFFGKTKLTDIDQDMFEEYCLSKKKKRNVKNDRKVMNHFMKWCHQKKVIGVRISFEIPKKARLKHRDRIVPDDQEVMRMIRNSSGNLLLYICMYGLMGMRNMEILHLPWKDVDFANRKLFIDGKNNRTRKDREIPINAMVFELLLIQKQRATNDWVFPNQRTKVGKRPHKTKSAMQKVFNALLTKSNANPELTPHDLRAFFETHMGSNPNFSDTQRKKMAGADTEVQDKIYIKMQASKLKGLEESVQIEGLKDLLIDKISQSLKKDGGKSGGKVVKK